MHVRTESGFTISVRAMNDHDRPPPRFAPGRLCREPNCGVVLSIYNEGDYCSRHNLSVKPRIRGRKPR